MKSRSLAVYLASYQSLWVSLSVLAFALVSLVMVQAALRAQETRTLIMEARRFGDSLGLELTEEGSLARAARAAMAEESPSELCFRIYGPSGTMLAENCGAGEPGDPAGSRSGKSGGWHRERVPLASGAAVVAAIPTAGRRKTVRTLALILLSAYVPVVLGATLLARRWISRRLQPLADMEARAAAAALDGGDLSLGPPSGFHELDRLKRAFEHLVHRLNRVLEAERIFTRDASHELQTPTTVVQGQIELAMSHAAEPEKVRESLRRAGHHVREMGQIIDALVLLRRAQGDPADVSALAPVNLADLARDVLEAMLELHPERRRDLELEAQDECLVAGTESMLRLAVRNLAENAFKFTESGTPVSVQVSRGDGQIHVVVGDGGPGIAAEERPRIQEPFFRGSEARAGREGAGIGLALVRQIVLAHHGGVTVDDSPLGGAALGIHIPEWRSTPKPASPPGLPGGPPP